MILGLGRLAQCTLQPSTAASGDFSVHLVSNYENNYCIWAVSILSACNNTGVTYRLCRCGTIYFAVI